MKNFLSDIVENLVLCDPMDRCHDPELYPAMESESDQTYKVAGLKKLIQETPGLTCGNEMQVALSSNMYQMTLEWFKRTQEDIVKLSDEYFECCKKYGQLHKVLFRDLPLVKDQQQMLEFFREENFLDSQYVTKELEWFDKYVTDIDEKAQKIREEGCTKDAQQCIQYFKRIVDLRLERKHYSVVEIFNNILDRIEERESLIGSKLSQDTDEKRWQSIKLHEDIIKSVMTAIA